MNYEDRDVTLDPRAVRELVGRYHSRSTPTFVIDEEVVIGFDKQRLDQLLG